MANDLTRRVAALEQQTAGPGRLVILWPGDPEPVDVEPNDVLLRVVYDQSEVIANEPTGQSQTVGAVGVGG